MSPNKLVASEYDHSKSPAIRTQATIFFTASIAALGAIMMTLTSSPSAKGASFLWLPAALQLLAGVWLGPARGAIAGGIGAYAAGILAYGGWGPVDIIMNPVAGGIANSFLPAILFMLFRVDPGLRADKHVGLLGAASRLGALLLGVIVLAFALKPLNLGFWGYLPSLVILLAAPVVVRIAAGKRDFIVGVFICIAISAVSAMIGCLGQVVGGQTWQAAILQTGIGWFLGDTVSAILGLYALAYFTNDAIAAGIALPRRGA